MNVAVVQARMGSSRLPGKVMKEMAGKPMIGHLFERVSRSKKINKVILATSANASDDVLCAYAASLGIEVFRGSENDVLDRIYQAVKLYRPKAIVRVTADSPLQDPVILDAAIDFFLASGLDYVSSGANPPVFPDGMDSEIFTFIALEKAWRESTLLSEREHVTPYIKNSGHFNIGDFHPDIDYSAERWVVDNEEDYVLVRAIFEALYYDKPEFGIKEIMDFKSKNKEIFSLNKSIKKNEGYFKSLEKDRIYRNREEP